MTDQRPPADPWAANSQPADPQPADSVDSPSRRRVLAGFGAAVGAALAGCSGFDGDPSFEERTVDAEGEGRNASEMSAAEALAEREADQSLAPIDDLSVEDHEFVLEDGFRGSTVQGTLANEGEERLQSVEVRVRVRDAEGNHLGRYVARTGDLAAGATWAFQVVLLESPDDVAAYDLAAFGLAG